MEPVVYQYFDGMTAHTCETCHATMVEGWIATTETRTYVLCRACMVALRGLPPDERKV